MPKSDSKDGMGGIGPSLLLTVEETAILLHLGRTTTYNLVMRRIIQSVKVGRRRLVTRDGVDEFIARLIEEQIED